MFEDGEWYNATVVKDITLSMLSNSLSDANVRIEGFLRVVDRCINRCSLPRENSRSAAGDLEKQPQTKQQTSNQQRTQGNPNPTTLNHTSLEPRSLKP